MSKASKLYKVFMTAMIVAIAGMLLASGIIALQKSMKLNLSFNMNPNIFCRIDASIGDNTSYNTIFCNTPDNATIGAGWSGNGNTLTFTNSSTDMLKTVYLKIWNHTETRVMIETTNHTSVISAGTLATGTQGSEFSVSVPANGTANLDFSQVFAVDVSGVSHATVTPESNVYTIGGTYYVKSGATPTFAIESSEHYDELDDVTVSSTAEKSFLNGVLTLSNITGDVTVTASADPSSYTITYYKNAGDTTTVHTTQSVKYGNTYSIPTEPTRADYTFLGWATSSGTTSATWEAGSTSTQTCSGNKDWYAQWTERIYTITFTSTTNNLQVNSINGTTITPIPSLQMKKTETKNVVVTSTTTGQWSRSVTYSVTNGSVDGVSLDTLTGDLTIANPRGDVTINVSVSDSNTFRPWTYGTYVNNEGSAVGDKVSYNTVHYPAFKGYKYIQFANHATQEANYYKSAAGDIGARWIIIGAGSSVSNATMLGAVQNTAVTSYAFSGTVNGKVGNNSKNDNLGDSQVLLLSEQTLKTNGFNSSSSDGSEWKTSAIRNFLNGDFLTNSGLNTYINSSPSYIVQPNTNLNTAYKSTSGSVTSSTDTTTNNKSSYIFLLGSRYGYLGTSGAKASAKADMGTDSSVAAATKKIYYGQNFVVEDYLGTDDATITLDGVTYSGGDYTRGTSTAPKLASFTGATSSTWWLRSGLYSLNYGAYYVNYYGLVDVSSVGSSYGVRPSFILNLA